MNESAIPHIEIRDLTMAYGAFVVQHDLNFVVNKGDIFVIMGGNGCGKSTLMRALIGLQRPATRDGTLRWRRFLERRSRPAGNSSKGGWASCSRAAPCGVR